MQGFVLPSVLQGDLYLVVDACREAFVGELKLLAWVFIFACENSWSQRCASFDVTVHQFVGPFLSN